MPFSEVNLPSRFAVIFILHSSLEGNAMATEVACAQTIHLAIKALES